MPPITASAICRSVALGFPTSSREERHMKVYEAINKVQRALAAAGISKDKRNTQQGYNFRGIDDVYNAVSPLLGANGLCILPRVLGRECVERQSAKGGALFYVVCEVEFDFVSSEDGSKHTCKTFGEAMDSADKATNKAMSAAYKYAVMQAFAIPTEGDNDADAHTHEVTAERAEARAHWLADQKAAIETATTVGELKRIVDAAIATAQQERDQDAEAQIRAAAATKAAKAKPKQGETA
jgi:hypothetical protein